MAQIVGSHRSAFHSSYTLTKDQEFVSQFRKLLFQLGFQEFVVSSAGSNDPDEGIDMTIADVHDASTVFQENDLTVQVMIGQNRIFLSVSSPTYDQDKVGAFVNAIWTWKESH